MRTFSRFVTRLPKHGPAEMPRPLPNQEMIVSHAPASRLCLALTDDACGESPMSPAYSCTRATAPATEQADSKVFRVFFRHDRKCYGGPLFDATDALERKFIHGSLALFRNIVLAARAAFLLLAGSLGTHKRSSVSGIAGCLSLVFKVGSCMAGNPRRRTRQ